MLPVTVSPVFLLTLRRAVWKDPTASTALECLALAVLAAAPHSLGTDLQLLHLIEAVSTELAGPAGGIGVHLLREFTC